MNANTSDQQSVPIAVDRLSRSFGKKKVLDEVSLEVSRGSVFGLVGENGAGKTTLIKHLLGLLRAQSGKVRILGMDPVAQPEEVLAKIGYLSENRDMPHWMRVRELMAFTQTFYPSWDAKYAEELRERFDLDPAAKIKTLSRGQRAQMGLLCALAHRPPVLVLDEPSSGLDAVVRRDILGAIIRTVADEGRTVLFSSHLLDEVERVADYVAMIDRGRMVLSAPIEEIRAAHHLLTLRFSAPQTNPPRLEGALSCEGEADEWTVLCNGNLDALRESATRLGATVIEKETPSLEDIFVARVRAKRAQK